MLKYINTFERSIVKSLASMMVLVIFISTIELAWIIVKSIIAPPRFFLGINTLLDIFGLFLLILIGIELLESIIIYITQKEIRVETVLLVGIIAIARKVVVLDIKQLSDFPLIGVGAVIIALAAGYYLIKQSHRDLKDNKI